MNYFSKMVAIIVAVALLFVVPAYRMYWIIDQAVIKHVNYETQEFVNTVRHKGILSKDVFENYVNQLSKTDNIYDIELKHARKVYYPLEPSDPGYSPMHTYTIINDEYHNQQILDTIYKDNKEYFMKKGDNFTVTVRNRSKTGSMVFLNLMGGNTENNLIFSKYGGMITNEDY